MSIIHFLYELWIEQSFEHVSLRDRFIWGIYGDHEDDLLPIAVLCCVVLISILLEIVIALCDHEIVEICHEKLENVYGITI